MILAVHSTPINPIQIRRASPFGAMSGWRLAAAIVKSNDDLRQEQFLSQLIKRFAVIAKKEGVPVWLSGYGEGPQHAHHYGF